MQFDHQAGHRRLAERAGLPGSICRLGHEHQRRDRDTYVAVTANQISVIGTPLGSPVKIDSYGEVLHSNDEYGDIFRIYSDVFEGSSGSGVYNEYGELAGVLILGEYDFEYEEEKDCYRARQVSTETDNLEGEVAAHIGPIIYSICDTDLANRDICRSIRLFTDEDDEQNREDAYEEDRKHKYIGLPGSIWD